MLEQCSLPLFLRSTYQSRIEKCLPHPACLRWSPLSPPNFVLSRSRIELHLSFHLYSKSYIYSNVADDWRVDDGDAEQYVCLVAVAH